MARIIAALALSALVAGCATYTERTSPCVCLFKPINTMGEATT